MKAIVADDHPLFRSAMSQALSTILSSDILEAEDFAQTLTLLEQNTDIELVFLDLKMPGNQGLLGLTRLRSLFPDVLVIIVSAEEQQQTIKKCIGCGACAYIPKSTPLPLMAQAIEQVRQGETWVPVEMLHGVEDDNSILSKFELLTPHQLKVLTMIADGLLNKQIAYEMGISESTIKQHASAILHRLEVNNRTQAGILFKQAMEYHSDPLDS